MALIDELKAKSEDKKEIRQSIIDELCAKYSVYLDGAFEKNFEKSIKEEDLQKREKKIYVSFWAYHSGCSTTNFRVGGWEWNNPTAEKYSCESRYYKGFYLADLQDDVLNALAHLLIKKLREMGFYVKYPYQCNFYIHFEKNNLDYIEDHITVEW